ncbi:MAG: hypothetical protein L6437_14645 [Kiritimatiellae bacterium]|nr:hypothetical protein [Kiritimatiellia bacterium]
MQKTITKGIAALGWALLIGAGVAARGTPLVIEAEKCSLPPGAKTTVVEDPQASGGKYVAVPEGLVGHALIGTLLQKPKPGRYHGSVRLRMDKLASIGRCFSVRILELPDAPQATHQLLSVVNAYGWRFPGNSGGWVDLPFVAEVSDFPKSLDINISANESPGHWCQTGTDTISSNVPAGAIDSITFDPEPKPLPAVRVVRVWPDKIRYNPREPATVTVTLQNSTEQPQAGELRCSAVGELTDTERIGVNQVKLQPRERTEVCFAWQPGRLLYGLEVRGEFSANGQLLDVNREFCQVHADAQRVAVEGSPDWGCNFGSLGLQPVQPQTSKHVAKIAERIRRAYANKTEGMSLYAPGAGFDQYSTAGVWMSYGGTYYRGFRNTILACGRELAKQGILWTPYFDGYSWSTKLEYWLERRPEWFLYDISTGDVLGSYDTYQLWKHKQVGQYGFDINGIAPFNGVPNYAREDTVDYAADQVIEAWKIFKMPGLRWDFHVTVWPGYADFSGKIVAKDYPEADAISAKMLNRFKKRINQAIPNFYWGYNSGSQGDIDTYPLTNVERDRGGAYILDECIYAAYNKSNPYHLWPAYLKYNADLQEWHRQRGGYFNPYAPRRGGSAYAVDRIYDTVLRAATGSYVHQPFYDSSLRFGNYPQFATRYSAFFYAEDRSRVTAPKEWLEVNAAATLWWEPVVYQRQRSGRERQIIVNLINPPVNPGLEEVPHNVFPPPVRDVTVKLKEQDGWQVSRAWLLMCEAADDQAAPVTQHQPLAVSRKGASAEVKVPWIFHWKVVVFELSRKGGAR